MRATREDILCQWCGGGESEYWKQYLLRASSNTHRRELNLMVRLVPTEWINRFLPTAMSELNTRQLSTFAEAVRRRDSLIDVILDADHESMLNASEMFDVRQILGLEVIPC